VLSIASREWHEREIAKWQRLLREAEKAVHGHEELRAKAIRDALDAGLKAPAIAKITGLSRQRIHQLKQP